MKKIVKILIFSAISIYFFSCKNNQKANQNFDDQVKKDTVEIFQNSKDNKDVLEEQTSTSSQQVEEILFIKDTIDCVFKEEKLLSHRENTNLFVFNNLSVSLKVTDEKDFNIIVNDIEYQTHIILDMGEIMVSNYKCDNKNVIIIHLEDYYGSIYFTYFYENENLFYLGSLSVDEPNVEKIGVQTKTFEIRAEKNVLEVISFLGGNLYDKKFFTQYEKIIKK